MSKRIRSGVWIEQDDLVRDHVDSRVFEKILEGTLFWGVEKRGRARALKFKAFYDREGRYIMDATILQSDRGVVAVVNEDIFKVGDKFYIKMNGKITRFSINAIRKGHRPEDKPTTNILYMGMD